MENQKYPFKMKDSNFYAMLDITEAMKDVTEGYYPKVEELELYKVKDDLPDYLPMIAFFASDPFTRNGTEGFRDNEYKETVKYCKDALLNVNIFNG